MIQCSVGFAVIGKEINNKGITIWKQIKHKETYMNEQEVKEVTAQAESTMPKQYEVGYGKPPKKTQFKPGQSGNPKGRTKGSRNGIYTYIQRELNSSITLTDGSKITKEQGFARQLTNQSIARRYPKPKTTF